MTKPDKWVSLDQGEILAGRILDLQAHVRRLYLLIAGSWFLNFVMAVAVGAS